jgi:5-methyltetrahydropteroyltriglutamate--homocysteine methyltransferase
MAHDNNGIVTTHTGSLPRPLELTGLLTRRDGGESVSGLAELVTQAVKDVVYQQLAAGLHIVNDGEAGKISYATYVAQRLEGFEQADPGPLPPPPEAEDFPDFFAHIARATLARPECVAPVQHRGLAALQAEVATLQGALLATSHTGDTGRPTDAFMTAASPGIIARYLPNRHYSSHEDYIWALADAMKPEYDSIHDSGLILQLDCPDLTVTSNIGELETHTQAINHATRDVPPDRMRLHLCWGNYEGPHTRDVPLSDIIGTVLGARPAGLSFEAANPRHEHEWRVFEEVALPEDKILIPGVIDSTTNYVEHPQLVADRIGRYARIVGAERVIAGTDCGFATTASHVFVHPTVAWAKLRALTDGARLASLQAGASVERSR